MKLLLGKARWSLLAALELASVGGCLAVGLATNWSQWPAIITVGAALVVGWPTALIAVVQLGSHSGATVTTDDDIHVINLPSTARLEPARYTDPKWVNDRAWVAKCRWQVTGASGTFKIVRAILERRWPNAPIEAFKIPREGADMWAAWFLLDLPPRPKHVEYGPRKLRGKVTLIDSGNRRHRDSIIFSG